MKIYRIAACVLGSMLSLSSISVLAEDMNSPPKDWTFVNVVGANQLEQKVSVSFQVAGQYVSPIIDAQSSAHSLGVFRIKPGNVSYITDLPPSPYVFCGTVPQQKIHNLFVTAFRKNGRLDCKIQYN